MISLNIFSSRLNAICEEMGLRLRRSALSSNIKDRLDYSCAIFDARGALCAQAAHIPVHLGSMAYAMFDIVERFAWKPGMMVVLNDPFLGGTHLPDVTLVAPVFVDGSLYGFVTNRAHHADIGAVTAGSMPVSRSLEEEGVLISPTVLVDHDELCTEVLENILSRLNQPEQGRGDFMAQVSANRNGISRLTALIEEMGGDVFVEGLQSLQAYGERLAGQLLEELPAGVFTFEDVMDDDGFGRQDIPIRVALRVCDTGIDVDFSGTANQVEGNLNCPLSVAAAAVFYVFRCLLPDYTPACDGIFRRVFLHAPEGCLLNPRAPAAVAAGNVETSMRIVDVVMGALAQAIPERMTAAGTGSMNNVAMGGQGWDYYETIGGGMGASAHGPGLSGVQNHMTNTLNTPIESLEMHFPLRVRQYALRRGSGGCGEHTGGDGLIRSYEFLQPAEVTLLTERRRHAPWGLAGGATGQSGRNCLNGVELPAKVHRKVRTGDILTLETAGGGGWGVPKSDTMDRLRR